MSAPDACVVGVFPHPDDEAYSAGGTLARCAEAGVTVHLVCATRGEGSSPSPERARVRTAELEESCRRLGARPPRFLELPDAGAHLWEDLDGAGRLARELTALCPAVVIALGADGAYGHRDHLMLFALLGRVLPALHAPPRALFAAFPKGLFAPVRKRLRRVMPQGIDGDVPLGVDRGAVSVCVDIRATRGAKQRALAAHTSQLPHRDPGRFLGGVMAHLLEEEWFIHQPFSHGPGAVPIPPGASDPLAEL